MKKPKIDWKYIIIELLIVVTGITIAFQVDNWNQSTKENDLEKYFIESFNIENNKNLIELESINWAEDATWQHIKQFTIPFFHENTNMLMPATEPQYNFAENPLFDNIVSGHRLLLNQQINSCFEVKQQRKLLNEYLTAADN